MSGAVVVVVRQAHAGDAAARGAVLHDAYCSLTWDAFLYFFFHETTLQGCVLCGAALFIFCGAGFGALWAIPVAAVLVLCIARFAHEQAASRQTALLTWEQAGWVAELRGPPRPPGAPPPKHFTIVVDEHAKSVPGGQVVGTVSLSACSDAAGGWLGALAVRRGWQRRGLARALEAAARRGARQAGHGVLHAVVSTLQPAARELLHEAGWEVSGCYARPLLSAALMLPITRLQRDLVLA